MTRAKPDSKKSFLVKAAFLALLSAVQVAGFAQSSFYDNNSQSPDDFFFYDYSEVGDAPVLYDNSSSQDNNSKSDLIIIYPSSQDEGGYYVPESEPEKKKKTKHSRKQPPPGIPAFTGYPEATNTSKNVIRPQNKNNLKPLPQTIKIEEKADSAITPYVPPVIQKVPVKTDQHTETVYNPEAADISSANRESFHKQGEVDKIDRAFSSQDSQEKPEPEIVTGQLTDKSESAKPTEDIVKSGNEHSAPLDGKSKAAVKADAIEIPGKQFSAIKPPGKPAMPVNEKTVHFYSDPQPLVSAPPPDPDFDPDFADFEASRIIPIIDAPAGFYDFSFEGRGIQIAASHTYSGLEIKAGEVVALNMITTNNSGLDRVFREKIQAPDGIKGVHEISTFAIKAGQSISRRISLHLDSALGAGEHHVSYEVLCTKNSDTSGKLNFSFAIKALPQLAFELMPDIGILTQKKPFKAAGKLVNTGNAGLNIHLKARGKAKNLGVSPVRVSLPAGGHAIVEISGITPERNNPLDDRLQLRLTAVSDKKSGNLQLLDSEIDLRIAAGK